MYKIIIIEDDPATREELTLLLENEGYQVLAVTDFSDVAGQLRDFGPHLVLLDLGCRGRTVSCFAWRSAGARMCPSSSSPAGTRPWTSCRP